ncbi:MAG: AAC(3) family N-acetyltransferase [Lentisphaeria bacterium]|nr:AAC(3) family N-acetyltransferase [Lentisphaeria bacterium]
MISKDQLIDDIKKLGIQAGDHVLVHASLSQIGQVDGGAPSVIEALLNVLTEQGTLLMPSFQSASQFKLLSAGVCFDLKNSPSELGLISETFRKMPTVKRSLNPTHSVAAMGAKADDILSDHHLCNVSTGYGSPYEKNALCGGKILLLGVDHTVNTTLHFVENTNGAPTLCETVFKAEVIDDLGHKHAVEMLSHRPGLKRSYTRVEPLLLAAGLQTNGKIGDAESRLINASGMIEMIGKKIQANPLFLIEDSDKSSAS